MGGGGKPVIIMSIVTHGHVKHDRYVTYKCVKQCVISFLPKM